MHRTLIKIAIICLTLCLHGCSGKLFTVYKIDVQQGNAVELEQVDKLKIGMNKEQVKFLLGSPLVADIFHPDRWDYVYYFIPGYGERERRHLTLYFKGDNVAEIIKNQIEAPAQAESETEAEQDPEATNETEES